MATPPYLSLISSAKDYNNPNSLSAYQRDLRALDGNDAWIVMLDSGFDLDRYPHVSKPIYPPQQGPWLIMMILGTVVEGHI
jgi:hypothetical protein